MTVRQLLANTSSAELTEWLAFTREHPIGDERADLRAAMVCQTIAASVGTSRKISDFLLKFGVEAEPKRQSVDEMKEFARQFSKAFIEQKRNG